MDGKKSWYIPDGWIPRQKAGEESGYEGHEALIVLNCNEEEAKIWIDFYFEDNAPIENVTFTVGGKRVKCFRMDKPEEIGGVTLGRLQQYALRVRSDVEIVVQFGRMDVTQPNCSYIGLMGYSE